MKMNKLQLHVTAMNLTHIMLRETSQIQKNIFSIVSFLSSSKTLLISRLEMRVVVTFGEDREGP